MATIVNTPAASVPTREEDSSSISSLVVGLLVVLVLAVLFFYFLLPMIRTAATGGGGQVNNFTPQAPAQQAPQINVPDKVNVDVNPNAGGGQ